MQVVLSLVVAGLLLPFVLARRRAAEADRKFLARNGKRGTGRVLEVWKDKEGWNITYEFKPHNTQEPVQKTESFANMTEAPVAVGATIEVAYDRSPPYYSVPLLHPSS